jgi:hypothetical protein
MQVSREDIKVWFDSGVADGNTHMMVMSDDFSFEYYPIYIKPDQIPEEVFEKNNQQNMQRVIEIYDLRQDFEQQVNQHRCWSI